MKESGVNALWLVMMSEPKVSVLSVVYEMTILL